MTRPLSRTNVLVVIMAFNADAFFEAKRKLINEAAKGAGWSVEFPRFDDKDILIDSFIAPFRRAHHVLADLSGERPSCYYELGMVEALGFPVTICAEYGTTIHQSSNSHRIQFYRDLDEFRGLVAEACAAHSHSIVPGGFDV